MKCKKCKKNIEDDSIFCKWCGSAQVVYAKKSMYQRPDGLYEKTVTINGKRKVFRGRTEKEVIKKIADYDGETEHGCLFSEIAEEWKGDTWERVSPNTIRNYAAPYQRAVDYFDGQTVKQITPEDVRSYLYDIIKKGYAHKTVLAHRLVLNQIMELAIIRKEITTNPVTSVKLPKNLPKTKRLAPTEEELKIILNSSEKPFGLFAIFVYYTGCRLGEALAITGADIDYTNKTLTIAKSVYWQNEKPLLKEPKTEAGKRTVPIPDVLFNMLPKLKKSNYLFGGIAPLRKKQYNNSWNSYRVATGLELTAHQLRHGYATLLYEAGVEVKDAQYLLGHSNVTMTLNIYTHISNSKKAKTMSKFNDYVNKNTQ